MRTITYSNFRNDLKSNLKQLRDDADVLLVTNRDPADNVIVMNERDYESMLETLRIYNNPDLHDKIKQGMQQDRQGTMSEHALLDA